MSTWLAELRRRHVFRVAAAYGVVAWMISQAASIALPAFDAPAWVLRMVIVFAILGFPIAVVLAWVYEITPLGMRRTASPEMLTCRRRQDTRGRFDGRQLISAGE
jgi:hypothetical protein